MSITKVGAGGVTHFYPWILEAPCGCRLLCELQDIGKDWEREHIQVDVCTKHAVPTKEK